MTRNLKLISIVGLACLLAVPAMAQNRTRFGGRYNAWDYAYGLNAVAGPLQVFQGNTSTGTASITLAQACLTLGDGTTLCPINTSTSITVGVGAQQDTFTPTSVSNCNYPASPYGACTITGTINHVHGVGDYVISGTYGLQEALNAAQSKGGGIVVVDSTFAAGGGTNAIITGTVGYSNVVLEDTRYGEQYWSLQPSTLTQISAPTTLTGTTVTFTATPVGTWPASPEYFCITYVDALGGESPCSASYTQTPTVNYTLNIASPAASTGAVGWRAYGGITSVAVAYLLPITATNCTLTTLESVIPACAIGSAGQWATANTTTTLLSPLALGVTLQNNPVPQSHTAFAYAPTSALSALSPFQTSYGPFASGTIASATAAQNAPLGTIELPAGYLNTIGRSVRLTGKIVGGATSTGTLEIVVGAVWAGGVTAGAPVTVCDIVNTGAALGSATYAVPFSCTLTTNAVGATAVGSLQANGSAIASTGAVLGVAWGDNSTSAVGSLGLFAQNALTVYIKPATAAFTAARLMSLNVETIQ